MRPHAVGGLSPALDHNFGLPQRVENLSIQQFVSQPLPSRRSSGSRPPRSDPARPARPLVAAWQQSLRACVSSSPWIRPPSALTSHTSRRTTSKGEDHDPSQQHGNDLVLLTNRVV